MAAVKLLVMYPPPKDVATFERLYQDEHVPMAVKKLGHAAKISSGGPPVILITEEQVFAF